MVRSLFEELRARFEPPPLSQPRITPNLFARVTRFAWRNAVAVILAWASLACLCVLASVLLWKAPTLDPAQFPMGNAGTSSGGLASWEDLQTVRLVARDPAKLRDEQRELVSALKIRGDVFAFVYSPGVGDYYDDRDMLYRPLDEVKARVAYALSLQPLFTAVAAAPAAQSMATLVTEIAGSVQAGRDPEGLDDLLAEAADSVQNLTRGEEKPVNWARIADLEVDPEGSTATILALPKPGQDAAARDVTLRTLNDFRHTTDTDAIFAAASHGVPAKAGPPFDPMRFASGLGIGLVFAGFLLALGFGRLSLVLAFLAPILALAPVFAALQLWAFGVDWLAYWPLWLGGLLVCGQVSLHLVMALVTRSPTRWARETSLMLSAQYEGRNALLLSGACVAPWLALAVLASTSTSICAALALTFAVLSFACALTLPPAIFRLMPGGVQWRAAQWFVPAHRVLFETGRWQVLSRVLAVVLVVISCAVIMALPNDKAEVQLDVPVSIMAQNKSAVDVAITRLQSFSRAKGVRWLGTFLPEEGAAKAVYLKQLKGQFPRIEPLLRPSPDDIIDLKYQIDSLQQSLQKIATAATAKPDLKDAADAFRRSLAILAATGNDDQLAHLENRLFGGFNRLADRADALASAEVPDLDHLPDELHAVFGNAGGPYRLQVTPAENVSNAELAIDLEREGFDVRHPAAAAEEQARAQVRSVLWVLGGGTLLVLLVVGYAFRDMQSVMIALAIIVAAGLSMAALDRFWGHSWSLTWLLVFVGVLSQLAASVYLTPAGRGSTARMAMEAFLAPVLVVALALPLELLNAGGIAPDIAFFAAGLVLVAIVVGLLHQHRPPVHREYEL
ncbi:hypothetical protein [Aestuariivirga litoralis]|uniref:hypothetical protein n=1 Tax=Aestuariivirga litoralis TaxID=2650924 RepID=UPI0018C7CCC2|nr:hypothetical protein [Aestuariivirga litoralis]MBG1232073.1 hypothetical protein [Aestuariivirga litoralis]